MTMKQYMAWKEENPDWDKDWSKQVALVLAKLVTGVIKCPRHILVGRM